MNGVAFGVLLLVLCGTSLLGTWGFVRYATRARLFDIPNSRSSHAEPVPRGGGLVFSVLAMAGLLVWSTTASAASAMPATALAATAAVLLLGFFDDRFSLSARLRLACQVVLAALFVWSLGDIPALSLFGEIRIDSEPFLGVLFVIGLVWMVNLYNFMDGIDSLAASEALFVSLSGAFVCWLHGDPGVSAWLLVLAFSLAGFIVWNLPPAKVFMGDAGSVFLGFFLGVVALVSHDRGGPDIWVWLILLGTFCVDATVTLFQRIRYGQRPLEAHRTHAYQYLARRHGSHGRVSTAVLAVNVCWLGPWALAATLFPSFGLMFLLIAYTPLFLIALRAGAGVPEER